jgi:chemotaxis protein MotB
MHKRPTCLRSSRDARDRWLISYTDILTLLLILFIAMAATAIGQSQARTVTAASSITSPPPAPAVEIPATPNPTQAALLTTAEELKQRGLELRNDPRGLVLSFPQAVLFSSGDDRINPSARPIIEEIVDALRRSDNKVELAGHADSTPIHTRRFESNWELSAARGLSLLRLLTSDYGIAESRLSVASYGAYNPRTSNDTADGRAENRRVEILILNDQAPSPDSSASLSHGINP